MSHITIPATGTGDATPEVQTDLVGGAHFQVIKLADGTAGSANAAIVDASGNLRVAVGSANLGILVGASVSNFPAFPATQPVDGFVGASVSNFPAIQPVSGSVSIVNTPTVALASSTIQVGVSVAPIPTNIGSVTALIAGASPGIYVGASVTNFPTTQPVSGNVTASVIGYLGASVVGTPNVAVSNFPGTQPVSGGVTASVIGYVGASTVPGYQGSVTGYVGASLVGTPTVNVGNFPGTQPISGNVTASVIGYVGASQVPGASVNAFNVGGSAITFPAAAPVAGIGASPFGYVAGASFNNILIKAAAGNVYGFNAQNLNASPRFLRIFDKATTPSPGVDQPIHTHIIPGATTGAGIVIEHAVPILHANGIGFDITGGSVGASDTTATSLGDVVVNFSFS